MDARRKGGIARAGTALTGHQRRRTVRDGVSESRRAAATAIVAEQRKRRDASAFSVPTARTATTALRLSSRKLFFQDNRQASGPAVPPPGNGCASPLRACTGGWARRTGPGHGSCGHRLVKSCSRCQRGARSRRSPSSWTDWSISYRPTTLSGGGPGRHRHHQERRHWSMREKLPPGDEQVPRSARRARSTNGRCRVQEHGSRCRASSSTD